MKRTLQTAAILAAIITLAFFYARKGEQTRDPASIDNNPAAATELPSKQNTQSFKGKNNSGAAATTNSSGNQQSPVPELESWTQTKDPFTGKTKTFAGKGFELQGQTEKEKSDNFLAKNATKLFGVPQEDLFFEKVNKAARTKVIYQQMTGGYPVYGSTLALLFENNELTRIQNDLQADPQVPAKPDVNFEKIFEVYKHQPNGGLRDRQLVSNPKLVDDPNLMPKLMLYPGNSGLVFVYQFYVDESSSRSMILFDPAGSRVVKKTSMHIR